MMKNQQQEERGRFPVITVHRKVGSKRRGMPWPLKGDKVTYEDAEGTFELHGVRAIATQLEVNEAQRVVVTFLGQLEIVDEEDTET